MQQPPTSILRRIDATSIELLPDGRLLIGKAGQREPLALDAATAYVVYLFCRLPGVAPALRRLDDERQREAGEQRREATST